MTWRRIFLLWPMAIAVGILAGAGLGALSSIVYQLNLPVGDISAPLVLMTSLITAAVGAWSGLVAGLAAVIAVALFDPRLRGPARRRNVFIGAAAGIGGYAALLAFYSGPSNLESPWTFAVLALAVAATAFASATLCGNRSSRLEPRQPRL